MGRKIQYVILAVVMCGCAARSSVSEKPGSSQLNDASAPDVSPVLAEFPTEPFRSKQPVAGPPRSFQIPELKQFSLPQGIKVYFVERHSLPTISLRLVFAGGSLQDPPHKRGVASVCMAMLSEGTKKLNKAAFEEAVADIASSISSSAGTDEQVVSMSTVTDQFDRTFSLYAEMLTSPGFRLVDFDRLIKRRLERLKQVKGSSGSVARRLTNTVLYGRNHPLGRVVTDKSLEAIQLRDCEQYFTRYIRPKRARLFVVGDITEAQIRAAFRRKEISRWWGAPKAIKGLPKPSPLLGKLFFVHIPKAAQSSIRLIHPGPRRKAEDYFATTLMASLFAGSFSGRMNMNLREDKGYSYGARGGFRYRRKSGKFVAGASVRSNATWQSLLELNREFIDIHTSQRPARASELARERQGAILSLPGRFATAGQAIGQYSQLVYYGLPLDYYESIVKAYQNVTLSQVNESARVHLKPDQLRILVVGDAEAPMIHRVDGKDIPLTNRAGKQMSLREALPVLLSPGELGSGELVPLDVDGN